MRQSERHIQTLKNPQKWFTYYRQQKLIADILLEKAVSKEELLKLKASDSNSNFDTIFVNAHYHWGISIENGFKGIFVKRHADKIEYQESNNDILIKNVGGTAGKTHNLLKLGEEVGIFDRKTMLCEHESDYKALTEVLLYLSDVIKWSARYPISHNTAAVFKLSGAVSPILVYGFHILDVLQPLFNWFETEITDCDTISES